MPLTVLLASCLLAITPLHSPPDSLDAMRDRIAAARARIDAQTKLYHDPVGPRTWIDGSRLWFCESAVDGARRWWLVDATKDGAAAKVPLFDHAALKGAVRGVAVEGGRVIVAVEGADKPLVFDLAGGAPTEADAEAAKALELRLAPGSGRTLRQGPSTSIAFANRLDEPVELFWVDGGGREKSYGRVAPHGENGLHTYGGHAWVVKTLGGEVLGHVIATDVDKTVVIERPSGAPGATTGQGARDPVPVDLLDGQNETQPAQSAEVESDAIRVKREGDVVVFRAGKNEFFRTPAVPAGEQWGEEWVSPAGDAVVVMRVKRGATHPVNIVEAAPKDRLEPKLRTLEYTKPGDEIDRPVPHLFRIERAPAGAPLSARELALETALYANPWSLDRARFISGGRELAFLYNQRGHQVVRLVAIDLATGAARTVAEQSYPTFVDYTNKVWMHWLDATGELLWMTERSGWNHIELIDVATGTVKRSVTEGAWNVRRVEHVDEAARTIDLALMGREQLRDPYHMHFARVRIDSGELTMLTSGGGTCRVDFSPDRSALVCVHARADIPPVYEVRRARDGAVVAELGAGDARGA